VFFFQAEDGIRVFHVTGVQTCALPISAASRLRERAGVDLLFVHYVAHRHIVLLSIIILFSRLSGFARIVAVALSGQQIALIYFRSEERRVGKECRWRGAQSE